MNYHYPAYYRRFICTGACCEDTCCAGWQIGIDQGSYRQYKHVKGEFGRRLQAEIDHQNHVFRLRGRRCAFLNDAGLCDIYRELGRDMLCRTCRTYPRHVEDYGDLQEVMLSLSCPEAARLILEDQNHGCFLAKERSGNAEPLKNKAFLKALLEIRQTMETILINRSIKWEERLAMALAFAHDIQRRLPERRSGIAAGTEFVNGSWEELSARYLARNAPARFSKRLEAYRNREQEKQIRTAAWIREAAALEPVVAGWKKSQEKLCRRLYHDMDMGAYKRLRDDFSVQAAGLELEWENLMLYFVHTFVLGAVYDGDVLGKVKLAIFNYIVIRENCLAASQKKGRMTREILVEQAYRYSREVENSDTNLESLEYRFCHSRLFGIDSIMTVLAGDA